MVCVKCGQELSEEAIFCQFCGYQINKEEISDTGKSSNESILEILQRYSSKIELHIHPEIPKDKLINAKNSCNLNPQENVLGLIDFTAFRSAKKCLLFCLDGIYFRNNPKIAKPEIGRIEYTDFKNRKFSVQSDLINFDNNELLDLSSFTLYKWIVLEILNDLKKIFMQGAGDHPEDQKSEVSIRSRKVVFPPLNIIKFPSYCIGCMDEYPSEELTMTTKKKGLSKRFGFWIGGAVGATIMENVLEKDGLMLEYKIPICSTCFNQLSDNDIKNLEYTGIGQSMLIQNIFFNRELKREYVIFNFKSEDYAKLFWDTNKDFVFTSVEEAEGIIERESRKSATDENNQEHAGREKIINQLPPHSPDSKWYVYPNVPTQKLLNALKVYRLKLQEHQVLALGDSTTFGSGKQGCLITQDGIYYKNTGEGKVYIPFDEIESCDIAGGFPSYKIKIKRTNGKKDKIECNEFKGVREPLNKFLNQIGVNNKEIH